MEASWVAIVESDVRDLEETLARIREAGGLESSRQAVSEALTKARAELKRIKDRTNDGPD